MLRQRPAFQSLSTTLKTEAAKTVKSISRYAVLIAQNPNRTNLCGKVESQTSAVLDFPR